MAYDFANSGAGMTYIGFNVDDTDAEYERVKQIENITSITEPKLWPWGAKSFRFGDPDGNMIVFRSWTSKR